MIIQIICDMCSETHALQRTTKDLRATFFYIYVLFRIGNKIINGKRLPIWRAIENDANNTS